MLAVVCDRMILIRESDPVWGGVEIADQMDGKAKTKFKPKVVRLVQVTRQQITATAKRCGKTEVQSYAADQQNRRGCRIVSIQDPITARPPKKAVKSGSCGVRQQSI